MSNLDRCCKRVVTNPGKREDWGPCNRFRGAHPGCGHPFEDGTLLRLVTPVREKISAAFEAVGIYPTEERVDSIANTVEAALTPAPAEATCDEPYGSVQEATIFTHCVLSKGHGTHIGSDGTRFIIPRFQPASDEGSDA